MTPGEGGLARWARAARLFRPRRAPTGGRPSGGWKEKMTAMSKKKTHPGDAGAHGGDSVEAGAPGSDAASPDRDARDPNATATVDDQGRRRPDDADPAGPAGADGGATDSAGADGTDADDDGVEAALARLEADLATVQDEKLRLLAEFQNHRRRVEKQLGDARADGMAALVSGLLPALHGIERALEAARGVDGAGAVVEGLELVLRDVGRALEQRGLSEVSPRGEAFDAELMEAVGQIPSPDVPEGHVAEVLQKGIRLGDRLIEPARVLVSMGAPADDAGPGPGTED